jgi:hypothetical protein
MNEIDELRAMLGVRNWLYFWHMAERKNLRLEFFRFDTAAEYAEHFNIVEYLGEDDSKGHWDKAWTGSILYDILQDRYGR